MQPAILRLGLGAAGSPWDIRSRAPLAGLLLVLCLALSFGYDGFASGGNMQSLLLAMTATGIAAIGTSLLVITRNVDLSIGGQYALVSVLAGLVASHTHSATLTVAAAMLAGALCGLVNGVLVRIFRINPLIVTLAGAAVLRGLAFVFSDGRSISGYPASFLMLGRRQIFDIPVPVLIAALLFIATAFILSRTVLGLRLYAIGGNVDAAVASGVPAANYVTTLFAFNGALIGVVACLSIARLGSASPAIGTGFEMDVLTAVLLGGVSFAGGSGNLYGVALGVATIVVINAGIVFADIPDFWQQITGGLVLMLSLIGDQVSARRKQRAPGFSASVDQKAAASPPDGAPNLPERTIAETVALICRGLAKNYGAVAAVRDVGFGVRHGEIVCLVGDNGAGKSTTIKMLSGIVRPDRGELKVAGKTIESPTPADVRAAGVTTVYQDLALCGNLGAAHNLALGNEPRRFNLGLFSPRDDRAAEETARRRLSRLGVDLANVSRPIQLLSGGQRQAVAIARADDGARCVILDEPTAALGVKQTASVLSLIRRLAAGGAGIILISHDLESIYEVADRIVVLRLGAVIWDGKPADLSRPELVHLMAGFAPEGHPDSLSVLA